MAIILSVNSNLDHALRQCGHTVISIQISHSGIYQAASYLKQCTKMPDIFLHREHLGLHIFFSDVHTLPCLTAHWGIDSHLRYWWQMYYASLFDVFFTPHKAFLERLSTEWLHPYMHRMAQPAPERSFIAHAQRAHDLNFVGRLSGTRFERKLLCKLLLERYQVKHKENIPYTDMLDLYNQTRIIPNESIAREVNFRLLEGCACGCALITPQVGEDQDCLFEPDKEILVYKDIDELEVLINRCLHEKSLTEKMGRRAWIRVQKEHVARHRAQNFMQHMESFAAIASNMPSKPHYLPSRRHTPHNTQIFRFSMGLLAVYGVLTIEDKEHYFDNLQDTPSLALTLRIFNTLKDHAQGLLPATVAQERVFSLLDQASHCLMGAKCHASHKKILAVAAGGAALHFRDAPRSQFYLLTYEKIQQPEKKLSTRKSLMGAENVLDVALNWIFTLRRDDKQCFLGLDYIRGCCRTAFDFVSLCRDLDPLDMRWFAALSTLDHVMHCYPHHAQQSVLTAASNTLQDTL